MNITKIEAGSTLTIQIAGRLDTKTAPQLDSVQRELDPQVTNLILDFADLTYVSSAGLRILLSFQKKMNKQGSMVIRNVCATIQDVFEVTGFSGILTVEN